MDVLTEYIQPVIDYDRKHSSKLAEMLKATAYLFYIVYNAIFL